MKRALPVNSFASWMDIMLEQLPYSPALLITETYFGDLLDTFFVEIKLEKTVLQP